MKTGPNSVKETIDRLVGCPGENAPFSCTFTKQAGTFKIMVEREVPELKVAALTAGGLVALVLGTVALVAGGVWLAFGPGRRV